MSQTTNPRLPDQIYTANLTTDEQHELLKARERRLALVVLTGQSTPRPLRELATEIVARKEDVQAGTEKTTEQLVTVLHHAHLPKMADMGVITYDPKTRLVTPPDSS